MFALFSFGSYLPRLRSEFIFAAKPLATWLSIVSYCFSMGYLRLPIAYASCSPRVAQALATFCSSLGYLLFGSQKSSVIRFLIKIPQKSVQCLPRFHLDLTCLVFIEKLFLPPNLWLLGYLLFSIVSPWATFGYLLSYARCSPRVAQVLATFCFSLNVFFTRFKCKKKKSR